MENQLLGIHEKLVGNGMTWRSPLVDFWQRNKCLILVIISQIFGALMNVIARKLQLEVDRMGPFQILFVRMALTEIFCWLWMRMNGIPLFGVEGVRWLLVLRGIGGFFGIWGMYYSLKYLPTADATVISFLAPSISAYACHLFFREPFPRNVRIASVISLVGVILVAQPTMLFPMSPRSSTSTFSFEAAGHGTSAATAVHDYPSTTASRRPDAIVMAFVGAFGGAAALVAIQRIGERVHTVVQAHYFCVTCLVVSTAYLAYNDTFALPASLWEWGMLVSISICGMAMQCFLALGLTGEGGDTRASSMICTCMIFALAIDSLVFGIAPGGWSIAGSLLITISAGFVAVSKPGDQKSKRTGDEETGGMWPHHGEEMVR
ncbi:integral membrane protein DUF6 [Phlyctema vagabunda]|uniref:Integral membrane protein DUF6 n=1 Tax=Phlyctema vagabunda TaxID=108571 RepID=A0ABR4PBG6_9HELO